MDCLIARRPGWPLSVLVVLAVLAWAPAAHAATFTVNSAGDGADALADGLCAAGDGTCTLRAAIEEANRSPIDSDDIGVSADIAGETVNPASALTIESPMTIDGCSSDPDHVGPCLHVRGSLDDPVRTGLEVHSDDVTIRGLALSFWRVAIDWPAGSESLALFNNWFGRTLDSTNDPNGRAVRLAGDNAIVGGPDHGEGNFFGASAIGLLIEGGDGTVVQGNDFSVRPLGVPVQNPGAGIAVTAVTNGPIPEGTLIGGEVTGEALTTPACDGPCNSFTRNAIALELRGAIVFNPGGPTDVRGNYFGLLPSGADGEGNGLAIAADGTTGVTVGGPQDGHRNYFSGNGTMFSAQSPTDLAVVNNLSGVSPDGSATESDFSGISLGGDLSSTLIADNVLHGTVERSPSGIAVFGDGAAVVGNEASGQAIPMLISGDGNLIGGSDQADANVLADGGQMGIRILGGGGNLIEGNTIRNNQGPGVEIRPGTLEAVVNQIGGDAAGSENSFESNSGPAVQILGATSVGNVIGRNAGGAQNRQFIDLAPPEGPGNDPASGPNGGVQAPSVAGASAVRATGTAEPGAVVRVYRMGAAPNDWEVLGLAGQTTAGADGRWSMSFASVPGTGAVTATQEVEDGSSELSTAAALGSAADVSAPDTSFFSSPPATAGDRTLIALQSTEPGTFVCRFDSEPYEPCTGFDLPGFPEGSSHTFAAIAVDQAGNADPTPVNWSFTVDRTPPDTTISGASEVVAGRDSFTVGSTEPPSTFRYAFDATNLSFRLESTTLRVRDRLPVGAHTVRVAALDAAGNQDPTPAVKEFTVVAAPPPPLRPAPVPDPAGVVRRSVQSAVGALKRLGIRKLLKARKVTIAFTGLAGSGTMRFEAGVGRIEPARRVVVVSGSLRLSGSGGHKLTAKLTKPGRKLLRGRRAMKLWVRVVFTSRAGQVTKRTGTVRLGR
jgi:CSLREA domain-containing protein